MTAFSFVFSATFPDLPGKPAASARHVGGETEAVRADIDPTDAALITRIIGTDVADARVAFDAIYDRTYQRLVRFAVRFVGDLDIAHDAVQEVFVSLWLTRATWRAPRGSDAYLYTAVRNRILKRIRHEAVVRHASASDIPQPSADTVSDVQAEQTEFNEAVHRVLAELPERRRTAFLLRAVDGLGYDAIGTVLGISGPAAYKHVVGATSVLRERLAKFAG